MCMTPARRAGPVLTLLRKHPDPALRRLALLTVLAPTPIARLYRRYRLSRLARQHPDLWESVDEAMSRLAHTPEDADLLRLAAARLYPDGEEAWWDLALAAR
jgi:hypothetical protein